MPELSPAAQAVMDAAYALPLKNGQPNIAAAIRAAADQVVPEVTREPHGNGFRWGGWAGTQGARRDLLAIAAELAGDPDHFPDARDMVHTPTEPHD